MDPKPIKITSETDENYVGPEPQPFVAVGGIPASDASVDALITDPESSTRASLNATIDSIDALRSDDPAVRQGMDSLLSWRRAAVGVIAPHVPDDWKATQSGVGIDVVWDHQRKKWVLVHGGDEHTGPWGSSVGVSQMGIVITDDIDDWYGKSEATPDPFFGPNPTAGQPDSGGVTYPTLIWDAVTELWHMFYIAFPDPGFEEGDDSSICVATCPTISTNPADWTRRGAMITSAMVPWVAANLPGSYIYRPKVVRLDGGGWGCFFNGGPYGNENLGYASAATLLGPWTAHATPLVTFPLVDGATHLADPDVIRIGSTWFMVVSTAPNRQLLATSTPGDFPLTWTWHPEAIWEELETMRTTLVDTPRGIRLFGFDRATTPYGKWGPVMFKPSNLPLPRRSDRWTWMDGAVAKVGTWTDALSATLPFGGVIYTTTNALNNSITFEVDLRCEGPWYFVLYHVKASNRGIYSIYLDDDPTPLGTIDGYAATEAAAKNFLTVNAPPFEGRHRIRVEVTSKHASSSGYNMTLCGATASL